VKRKSKLKDGCEFTPAGVEVSISRSDLAEAECAKRKVGREENSRSAICPIRGLQARRNQRFFIPIQNRPADFAMLSITGEFLKKRYPVLFWISDTEVWYSCHLSLRSS